jgi:hypothetical protein
VVKLDGQVVSEKAPGCPSEESCTISLDWVLHPQDYTESGHTITVSATDGVGRTTVKTLPIEIAHDTASPTLSAPGELFGSLSGWVEQETYEYEALAEDAGGYGVTSLVLKIDGVVVASKSQACSSGGCSLKLTGSVNTAAYEGGAHPAELIATDGAGNTKTRKWKINVNPKGQISSEEATATLEAVDDTASLNTVGESEEEEGVEGTAPGLGVEEVDGHLLP